MTRWRVYDLRFLTVLSIILAESVSIVSLWETANRTTTDYELVLVHVVFRHGDRNINTPYPNDPYKNETNWPEGFGQLTKIGKSQQYELGKYLRQRYDGFLSPVYSPYEIYVQSSTADRAIMSAQANLAGLYPPPDNESKLHPDIAWQPIPVHTMPTNIDSIIQFRNQFCKRYDQISNDFKANSDVTQRFNAEHKELFQFLSKNTGKNIASVEDVYTAVDTLNVEKLHNKTLPPWAIELFEKYGDQTRDSSEFHFQVLTYTLEMKRLRGGPLVKEITEQMKDKSNHSMDDRRKFFMYSAHDKAVAALLDALEVFNGLPPPYCSMVMIELHRNIKSNKYFVEVMYRNSTTTEPYKLQLPGCEFSCELSTFLDVISNVIPDDWEKECIAVGPAGYDATTGIL